MITGKIDVMKIIKSKLYQGKKGTYLDFALIPTPDSEYGDYMIVQDVGKEARRAGERGPILGNAKNRGDARKATRQDDGATGSEDPAMPF